MEEKNVGPLVEKSFYNTSKVFDNTSIKLAPVWLLVNDIYVYDYVPKFIGNDIWSLINYKWSKIGQIVKSTEH